MTEREARSGSGRRIGVIPEAFRKQDDGSWTAMRNAEVGAGDGLIIIPAGMDFRRGTTLCGGDIAMLLDVSASTKTGSQPAADKRERSADS